MELLIILWTLHNLKVLRNILQWSTPCSMKIRPTIDCIFEYSNNIYKGLLSIRGSRGYSVVWLLIGYYLSSCKGILIVFMRILIRLEYMLYLWS